MVLHILNALDLFVVSSFPHRFIISVSVAYSISRFCMSSPSIVHFKAFVNAFDTFISLDVQDLNESCCFDTWFCSELLFRHSYFTLVRVFSLTTYGMILLFVPLAAYLHACRHLHTDRVSLSLPIHIQLSLLLQKKIYK